MEDLTEPVGETGAPTPPAAPAEGTTPPPSPEHQPSAPAGAGVTGPLEREFAQVREAIEFGYGGDPNYRPFYYEGMDALSAIERHVQDMEKALHEIAYAKERQPVKKTTGVRGEPRFIHSWPSRSVALAALPAREKGRE